VLARKGNEDTLREDVELLAAEQKAADFKDTTVSRHQTVDGDHGRIETRVYTAFHDGVAPLRWTVCGSGRLDQTLASPFVLDRREIAQCRVSA
jgi:hypothetical protein